MAVQTVENIQRLPPFLEGLQKRLLQTGFGEFDGEDQTTPGLLDTPLNLPQFQIAGIDPLRTRAISLGENLVSPTSLLYETPNNNIFLLIIDSKAKAFFIKSNAK